MYLIKGVKKNDEKIAAKKLAGAMLAAALLWAPSFGTVDAAVMPDKTITAETDRVLSSLPRCSAIR